MLREFAATARRVLAAPGAVLVIAALALAACGIKGPLKLPPTAGATPSPSTSPPAGATSGTGNAPAADTSVGEGAERKP